MNRMVAQIFKGLADETRLRMLFFLTKVEELCVCDFLVLMDISQSKASRHLRYLLHAGLVQDRREAVWVHYRLASPMGREQAMVVEAVRHLATPQEDKELSSQLKKCLQSKGGVPAPAKGRVRSEIKKKGRKSKQ